MIDVDAEPELVKERRADLGAQLGAALAVVDRTGVEEAVAESRRLRGHSRSQPSRGRQTARPR
jgi:hypothetical protein